MNITTKHDYTSNTKFVLSPATVRKTFQAWRVFMVSDNIHTQDNIHNYSIIMQNTFS